MRIKPVRFKVIHSDIPHTLPDERKVLGGIAISGSIGVANKNGGLPVRLDLKYRFYIDGVHSCGFVAEDLNILFFEKGENPMGHIMTFLKNSMDRFFDAFKESTSLIAGLSTVDELGINNLLVTKAGEIIHIAHKQLLL